jgi:hypothetical protein
MGPFSSSLRCILGATLWLLSSCTPKQTCNTQMQGELAANAVAIQVDVYGASVKCYQNAVDHSAGAPEDSRHYQRGQSIELSVPPGPHTMVVTTFSDAAMTLATGSSCFEQQLPAGGQLCFSLLVTPIVVGCGNALAKHCDATCCDPLNGSCNVTCALDCDPGWADCNNDASDGCEVSLATADKKLCGNVCFASDSCCTNADCIAEPFPAACYVGMCSGAGGACTYVEKSTATICGGTCCNAIGGNCRSDCTLMCLAEKGNCNGDSGDGCETDLRTSVAHCGACGRACRADSENVDTAVCAGGVCASTSKPGPSNCSQPAASMLDDGCECATPACCAGFCQTIHTNGFGQTFFDCVILGEYDENQASKAAKAYNANGVVSAGRSFVDPGDASHSIWAVCNSTSVDCPCWAYSSSGGSDSTAVGRALVAQPASPTNCLPPFTATVNGARLWN